MELSRNLADWLESLVGPLYVIGSVASAGLADVVPAVTNVDVSLMDTVNLGGVPVMWGTLLASAALAAAGVVQLQSEGEIGERGWKVILADVISIVAVTFVPAIKTFVLSTLLAGIAYFLLGVAAYYYISYA